MSKSTSSLLSEIYATPLDATRWQRCLQMITNAVGGESAALFLHDTDKAKASTAEQWNLDPQSGFEYAEHFVSADIWRRKLILQRDSNWVGPSDAVVPFSQLERTEFYGDFLKRYHIAHSLMAVIDWQNTRAMNLSVYRGSRRGEFSEKNVALLRYLSTHIQRAVRLHFELTEARNLRIAADAALDLVATAIILVDEKKHIIQMNEAARRILAQKDGLVATRDGLRIEHSPGRLKFEKLINSCINGLVAFDPGFGGGIAVLRNKQQQPLHLFVSPVGVECSVWQRRPAAIVLINDPAREVRPAQAILKTLFGLTPAECRIALMVASGYSKQEMVDRAAVSSNTIKTHLSAIFVKTGVRRQAELVKLLSLLPDSLSSS